MFSLIFLSSVAEHKPEGPSSTVLRVYNLRIHLSVETSIPKLIKLAWMIITLANLYLPHTKHSKLKIGGKMFNTFLIFFPSFNLSIHARTFRVAKSTLYGGEPINLLPFSCHNSSLTNTNT